MKTAKQLDSEFWPELSEQREYSIDEIGKYIETNASMGDREFWIKNVNISKENIFELIKLGFGIREESGVVQIVIPTNIQKMDGDLTKYKLPEKA